jgi:hypothetical protein
MPTSDSFCAGLHQPFSRYPADKRFPAGKLGLLCECAPLAFLVEQAGGMATNGYERILDISPEVGLPQTPSCAARACDEIYQKSERALRVNRVCACVRVCVCACAKCANQSESHARSYVHHRLQTTSETQAIFLGCPRDVSQVVSYYSFQKSSVDDPAAGHAADGSPPKKLRF